MTAVRYAGPRRRSRALPVLVFLVALGAMGFLGYKLWARTAAPVRPAPPAGAIGIPVARTAIAAGTMVTGPMLDVIYRKPDVIGPEIIASPRDVVGRVVLVDKLAGQAFTKSNLAPEGTRPGLAATIPPGKRALTIDVTRVEGTTGYLSKGDSLDVLAVHPVPTRVKVATAGGKGHAPMESDIIATGAIVLVPPQKRPSGAPRSAGGHSHGAPAGQPPSVEEITLAVDPGEARAIAEAVEDSTIRFLVHSARPLPKDRPPAAPSEEPEPDKPPVRVIEVIKGTQFEGQVNR